MRKIFALSLFSVFVVTGALRAQTQPARGRLWGAVEVGIAPAVVDANHHYDEREDSSFTLPTVGVNVAGGFFVLPKFSVGAGAGLAYLDNSRLLYAPVFGELKYAAPSRRDDIDYFVYGRGGCPLMLGRNHGGGALAGVGWGITLDNRQRTRYTFAMGYSLTRLDYRTGSGHPRKPTRHAVELRVGLLW